MTTLGNRIQSARLAAGLTVDELASRIGKNRATIYRYEKDEIDMPLPLIVPLATALHVSPAYLMGWEETPNNKLQQPLAPSAAGTALVSFPVIGKIDAGYDGQAREEYTGAQEAIPVEDLHGRPASDFMVLRVNGSSMYPLLLDGDRILVERTTSVDSGSLAVVLYNGEDATVKRVRYVYGEDWLELIPQNPEYQTKRIEGPDLEECRVIGKVLKLIRTLE